MRRSMIAIVCGLLLGVTMASAQPPGKGPPFRRLKPIQTAEDVESLKKGDKVGMVCLQCHTLSELTVEGSEDAAMLCKEGAMISCPSCKKSYKVAYHGQRGSKGNIHSRFKYVNDKGEECAFLSTVEVEKAAAEDEK